VTPKSISLTPELHSYLVAHGTPPDEVQRDLIRTTQALGDVFEMQIAPEQGAFMTVLARLCGARRAVEVGTFTGYSSLSIARGMSDDGHLLCCDVSREWTQIAQDAWRRAGVDHKIELRLGPAADTLRALPADPVLDLAFIDADKENYPTYYEELLPRMRPGGVIVVDNVLWHGDVVNESSTDERTELIRRFNAMLVADERVDVAMLPIADGLTLAVRRDAPELTA
jgi:caffeoyl-CoA O-methyltransferase